MTHQDALLTAAREYHARGVLVFPLRRPDDSIKNLYVRRKLAKMPATVFDVLLIRRYNATAEKLCRHIVKRRAQGMAIMTGKQANLVVIDVDFTFGGEASEAALNLPPTLTVKTPRGKHAYFTYPKNATIGYQYAFMPGIDLMGDSGTVTVPPSKSIYGIDYAFEDPSVPIAPFPEALIVRCKDTRPQYLMQYYLCCRAYYFRIPYHHFMQRVFGGVPADWQWKKKWTARKKNTS